MYYLFIGDDTIALQQEREKILAGCSRKYPHSDTVFIGSDDWRSQDFEHFLGAQGLFSPQMIISYSFIFDDAERSRFVSERAEDMEKSDTIFLFLDRTLPVVDRPTLEKYAEKVFKNKSAARKMEFNVFSISDAFARRDKKRLWVLYHEALRSGLEAEQIHGTIFWQVKMLLLASKTKSAVEAGVKDYPYTTAKRAIGNFADGEVQKFSSSLVAIYHDARRGISEMPVALERFILQI